VRGWFSFSEDKPAQKYERHHQQSAGYLSHANSNFGKPDGDLDEAVKDADGDKCVAEDDHTIWV
jgi:hypothetical protein